jgi:chorismate mutase/prephenate dehydratase
LPLRISYQGEPGAYSEQACLSFFGPRITLDPCEDLSEVFRRVERGMSDRGVVPAENSVEGTVNQTYDLLLHSKLKITGETNLKIVHCLIGFPGTKLNEIREVYSHPQALAQCRRFIIKLGYRPIPAYDTAGSIKIIKEKGIRSAAAIASESAASIYQMKVLRRGIGDVKNNFTRFFILAKHDSPPTGRDKTSIVFGTRHVPGALHRALTEFAERKVNLTKIESRPTRRKPWEYNFYIDFEGHRKDDVCSEALRCLKRCTSFLRILGSYPRA